MYYYYFVIMRLFASKYKIVLPDQSIFRWQWSNQIETYYLYNE